MGDFFLKNHPFLQLIMQYLKNAFMHFGVKIQSFSQNFKGENSKTKTKIRKNFGVKIQSLLHRKILKEKNSKTKIKKKKIWRENSKSVT